MTLVPSSQGDRMTFSYTPATVIVAYGYPDMSMRKMSLKRESLTVGFSAYPIIAPHTASLLQSDSAYWCAVTTAGGNKVFVAVKRSLKRRQASSTDKPQAKKPSHKRVMRIVSQKPNVDCTSHGKTQGQCHTAELLLDRLCRNTHRNPRTNSFYDSKSRSLAEWAVMSHKHTRSLVMVTLHTRPMRRLQRRTSDLMGASRLKDTQEGNFGIAHEADQALFFVCSPEEDALQDDVIK
ncbi:hypothetical protein GQ44DRAFT_732142 [Phaeosphaeriaceae sp. PMI808]|nr:hypothetical protein GQ44DRAFT_732142 [Phaeosphaeriaceae sp. PMI808]